MEQIKEELEQPVELRDYLAVLVKRRWILITCFVLIFLISAVYTFSAAPVYRAAVTLVIEKENPKLLSIQEVMPVDTTSTDYYQTQYQIIQSRAVARQVVRKLDLGSTKEFNPPPADNFLALGIRDLKETVRGWKTWLSALLRRGPEAGAGEADKTEPDAPLVDAFLSRVVIDPVRNSRMVHVGVEARDPALAARMANELTAAYIDQNLETKLQAARTAASWLADRVDEERLKVEKSELALLHFKEANGITSELSNDVEQITAQKIAELEEQIVEARSRRVEAETRYRQATALEASPEALNAIPEVMSNDLVRQIKRLEVDLYNQLSEYSGKYGANHPKIKAIRAELSELKERKRQEVNRVVRVLHNEFVLAESRENTLSKALDEQKAANLALSKKAVQITVLQRQVESARNTYDMLIKRFKETSLTGDMREGNIRVVDAAEVPRTPISPNKGRNLLLAAVVGLMVGVGLCFFLEYLDNSIKLPDEVRSQLGLTYLGPIPAVAEIDRLPEYLIETHLPKSPAAEALRGIRTAIQFSSAEKPPQVILVASSERDEGKTFFASNLAVVLAKGGAKVALVDCDMRNPNIHKVFKLRREVGVSNVLTGMQPLEAVAQPTSIENLCVLPCGPVPPNPAELLGSRRMAEMIAELRSRYDHVLIDSPPLAAVADAASMTPLVDGMVMVIRAACTPRPVIQSVLDQLRTLNAPILGAVLNGVVNNFGSYYHYYYYYYGKEKERGSRHRSKNRRLEAGNEDNRSA